MVDAPQSKAPRAWEPLTPVGVAGFASARISRLWLVQALVALVCAAAVVWFVHHCWFPVVGEAISKAPASGVVRLGLLHWYGESPVLLAENSFLAIGVDINNSGQARSPADVHFELQERRIMVRSLHGASFEPYPRRTIIAANRTELQPWWGAWAPAILAVLAAATICWLMVSWFGLASVYCLPAWLLAFFMNRQLTISGAWKLCGAALLPAALALSAGVMAYGLGLLNPIAFLLIFATHFVVGWAYVLAAIWMSPRYPGSPGSRKNPFAGG